MSTLVLAQLVQSSNLRFIGRVVNDLYVEFKSGKTYLYRDVHFVLLDELFRIARGEQPGSVGSYFNQRIKAHQTGIPSPDFTWRFQGDTGNPQGHAIRSVIAAVLAPDPVWSF